MLTMHHFYRMILIDRAGHLMSGAALFKLLHGSCPTAFVVVSPQDDSEGLR